jgi:histidyl-tRNA synthetase
LGLGKAAAADLIRLIDRMHKLEEHHFAAQLAVIVPKDKEAKVRKLLGAKTLADLPNEADQDSVNELRALEKSLQDLGITNAGFDITLMRGFDYYTDIVFEVFDNDPENNRSMFGGGRYDGLVGLFGVEPVPTVGFGMGDVTLENFLVSHNLVPKLESETNLYAILIGDVFEAAQKPLTELRKSGVNVALDSTGRKIDKQIKSATKKGINNVLFIGEEELNSGKFKLKNLETGKEQTVSTAEIQKSLRK